MTSAKAFSVKPLNITDKYYGFSLKEDPYHQLSDGTIAHNSGKSVTEQSIIGHVSRFSERFQLVGVNNRRMIIEPHYSRV